MLKSLIESRQKKRQLIKHMSGEPGLPLVGFTLELLYRPVDVVLRLEEKYGPVFWGSAFGLNAVFMVGADANQLVLRNQEGAFSNNQGWDYFIGTFFNRGLMLLDFDEHRFHRGIMQAAFKKSALQQYLGGMNPAIQRGIDEWRTDKTFHVLPHIKQLTLDIATDVFMGEKLGKEADQINKAFIDCVLAGTAVIRRDVPGGRWHKGLKARKVLEDFFRSRISHRRANPTSDLFSFLCMAEDENGQRFTDEDVVNHMIFLLMAAHDTTTLTLSAMFYYLAKHPEWQERVREEARGLNKQFIEHEDIVKMDVTTMVMRESMRLISPVHVIPRRTVKDIDFEGKTIPKGTFVIVSPYVTHRMSKWWTFPDHFDPERFNDVRKEHKEHPYKYVPFGGGAHMCIGLHFAEMQIKAILHQVVQQYSWSVPADYIMPINFTSLPSPRDKLPVRLQRLNGARSKRVISKADVAKGADAATCPMGGTAAAAGSCPVTD